MTCKVKIGVFGDDFSPQCEGGGEGRGGEDKRTSGQADRQNGPLLLHGATPFLEAGAEAEAEVGSQN